MELVFATNNSHKLAEIGNLLGRQFELKKLSDIGFSGDIPETFPTIEQNASAKSRFIQTRYRVNCFADDTGLEVDSLNGLPGVMSARFALTDLTPNDEIPADITAANIKKLLKLMYGKELRTARFRTVISLILDGDEYLFEGVVNGQITTEIDGNSGFGYDPVFIPDGHNLTFARMTMDEKNRISHRSIAFAKLITFLKSKYPQVSTR